MSKFLETKNGTYLNTSSIVSLYYDKEDDRTIVFTMCDGETYFTFDGNVIDEIIASTNDLTIREKAMCNYIYDKLKWLLKSIDQKLDCIKRK